MGVTIFKLFKTIVKHKIRVLECNCQSNVAQTIGSYIIIKQSN